MKTNHRFADPQTCTAFLKGGNARLTLVSGRTGTRFTYRVRIATNRQTHQPIEGGPWFVSVLTGPDNNSGFEFIGTIFGGNTTRNGCYRHQKRGRITVTSPSSVAFAWFFTHVVVGSRMPPNLEVWHEGRCGRCGRALTVPESIASGLGPECAAHNRAREEDEEDEEDGYAIRLTDNGPVNAFTGRPVDPSRRRRPIEDDFIPDDEP